MTTWLAERSEHTVNAKVASEGNTMSAELCAYDGERTEVA
jgi:hypothetical protein